MFLGLSRKHGLQQYLENSAELQKYFVDNLKYGFFAASDGDLFAGGF